MKEVVIILSHADSPDKLEILDKCIREIKSQGHPIIIATHIQVPQEYYDIVDYVVYDKENPLIRYDELPGAPIITLWHTDEKMSHSYSIKYNHSYAVMKLIKSAIGLAYSNGYEKAHFVNYDYVIKEYVLKRHSLALEDYDIFSYYNDDYDKTRKHVNTGLFSVKVKPFLEASNLIENKHDFLSKNQAIFESFVYQYYVEEIGMSIKLDDCTSISKGNILNNKSLLKNIIDDSISVYLDKEKTTGRYYIYVKSNISKFFTVLIKVKDIVYTFNHPENYYMPILIDVTDSFNEHKLIDIHIPEYNFFDMYDTNTHFAECEIRDYSSVKNLESLELSSMEYPEPYIIHKNNTGETKKTFKEISDHYDCDKSTTHEYYKYYPAFLEKFRDQEFYLFEIGIQLGKSYNVWMDYFPYAKIYGMDIGVEYTTDRGEVFLGDQNKLEDLTRVSSKLDKCKLILDDASHVPEHQLKTFYYLFENLLDYGGVYIIEDTECSYWSPSSTIYGYETGYLNIIDYFTKLNHKVNSRYNLQGNELHIKTITFAPNCIIITKKEENELVEKRYYS